MKWPLHTKIGFSLILVGLAPFIVVELMAHAHNWTPVDAPVVLKPGEFRSPEFKIDLDGRYVVSLAADQLSGDDLTKEHCMMEVGSKWDCHDVKWTLQFDCQIISEKRVVIESGVYEPIGMVGTKTVFAEFQGHGNSRQSVILEIQKDAGDLNNHHPRLVVEAGAETWELLPYLYEPSLLWAGVVGVLGIVVILLPTCWKTLNR